MANRQQLLEALNIRDVIWIDDENARVEDFALPRLIQHLSRRLSEAAKDQLQRSISVLKATQLPECRAAASRIDRSWNGREQTDPLDAISAEIDSLFAKLPTTLDPKDLAMNMLAQLPRPLSQSEKDAIAGAFANMDGLTWQPMSFTEWSRRGEAILSEFRTPNRCALLVVDLQNDFEDASLSGEDVLAQWAQSVSRGQSGQNIFAIAFTSTFRQEEELKEGRHFTARLLGSTSGRRLLPILVLSKTRLTPADTPESSLEAVAARTFEGVLSRLRACVLHWKLSDSVRTIFAESVTAAFENLGELSIEEMLMAISGKHTRKEGASDIDTLVRMAGVAQRGALLTKISRNTDLTGVLVELRGLAEAFTAFEGRHLANVDGIVRLRAAEVYDPGTVVNSLLSPLATGDLFEFKRHGEPQFYVLASNMCDLMLRGHTGARKLEEGLLLRVRGRVPNDGDFKALPSFPAPSPLANLDLIVDYCDLIVAPLDILDLCWTNQDGYCKWRGGRQASFPLAPSQSMRLQVLMERFSVRTNFKAAAGRLPGIPNAYRACSDQEEGAFDIRVSVRRIGRIADAFAHDISEGFARYLARHSFPHDLAAG